MTGSTIITPVTFIVLTVVMYYFTILVFTRGIEATVWDAGRKRRTILWMWIGIAGWAAVSAFLAIAGVLADFSTFPPRMMLVLFVPLVTLLTLTFLPGTQTVLRQIPIGWLTRLQFFRVVVELLLWMLFMQQLLPVQMTFEGRNFDVLAGLSAPLAAWWLTKNKTAMVIWNVCALALLINIIVVAILSLPGPMRYFMNEPANVIVTTYPYVWLPALLVPLAYGLHFFSLRKLLSHA
ncbi:MAG: hypothetical protein U0V64_09115 [Cyclobacteriaceae bacterium]